MPEYATAARLSTDYNNNVCDLQREIALFIYSFIDDVKTANIMLNINASAW